MSKMESLKKCLRKNTYKHLKPTDKKSLCIVQTKHFRKINGVEKWTKYNWVWVKLYDTITCDSE